MDTLKLTFIILLIVAIIYQIKTCKKTEPPKNTSKIVNYIKKARTNHFNPNYRF